MRYIGKGEIVLKVFRVSALFMYSFKKVNGQL